MKRIFYIIALSVGMLNEAAAEKPQPHIYISTTPATVANALIREGVENSSPEALKSPVGKLYSALNENPKVINSLGEHPLVAIQTKIYSDKIQANEKLKELAVNAKLKEENDAPEEERIVALTEFSGEYGILLKTLIREDIPTFTLSSTVKRTIECNTGVSLGKGEIICLKAAQLIGGLILQEQWEIDPKAFELIYKRFSTLSTVKKWWEYGK